ncbi:hypothetical protein CYY_003572 [Polysphondylium violaceum]|uniref:Pleckstrin domain-containing protein n=1 Tax=Polysphondylium violaceum TaxID=133409 RepID=A0A8J4V5T9_9MYCE|nr:hypothetical protein CYY_003572 [Polysphondylium violaceum]
MSSSYDDQPLQGYIIKLGKYVKSWYKRWMVVEGESLNYYTTEDKSILKGSILLTDIEEIKLLDKSETINQSLFSILSHSHSNSNNHHHHHHHHHNNHKGSSNTLGGFSHSSDCVVNNNNNANHHINNSSDNLRASFVNSSNNNSSGSLSSSNSSITSGLSGYYEHSHSTGSLRSSLNANHKVDNHSHQWIFSIKVPDRVYIFKASNEFDMHYWIQGIKNIQVERALKESMIKENQRNSKKIQSNDWNPTMISDELVRIKNESNKLKIQYISNQKEIHKQITDFNKWTGLVQDQFERLHQQIKITNDQYEKKITTQKDQIDYLLKQLQHFEYQKQVQIQNDLVMIENQKQQKQSTNSQQQVNNSQTQQQQQQFNNNQTQHLSLNYSELNITLNDESCKDTSKSCNNIINNQLFPSSKKPLSYVSPTGIALWFPDDTQMDCHRCKSHFTIFRRRHHCRNCGLLFCSKCCSKYINVKGYIGKAVRVCEDCHVIIALAFTSKSIHNNK